MTEQKTSQQVRTWSWAQVAGATGVIVSLLFVATEIRQNTAAVRGGTFHALSDTRREMLLALNEDSELASAWNVWMIASDEWSTLPGTAQGKVQIWLGAYYSFLDNAYYQVRLGTLPRSAFETWMIGPDDPVFPRAGEFWQMMRSRFTPEFREYVDGI